MSAEFQSEVARLKVSAQMVVAAAPMVITGVTDGRAFYLRERHGSWRVTIATDDDPTADPWGSALEAPSIDIASGDESDFNDGTGSAPELSRCVSPLLQSETRSVATIATTRFPSRRHTGSVVHAVFPLSIQMRGHGRHDDWPA